MSEPRYREWILDTIDSLRSRKARPDLDRICRMVRRRHGSEPDRTSLELERLIQEHAVLKVTYKGSVSYRNAAKVQRGRRRSEQAAGKKSSSSSSSSSSCSSVASNNKRVSPAELNNSDSAQGPDDDPMEDIEDELSTTAGLDSSMDEEEVSLDAPCTQITSSTDSGIPLSPAITDPDAEVTRSSPTPSKSVSFCHSTPEKDGDSARVSSTAQRDTGCLELELEAAMQQTAVCPSDQRRSVTREEEPRAGESALTPDQLLLNSTTSPHQDEAAGSDHTAEQKCNNADDVCANAQGTETPENGGMKKGGVVKAEEMTQDLLQWSVADVVSYFTAVGFPEQAVAFRMQEIDGKSLLLMQRSDVLTGLSIRLGPALKIYEHHVKVLQQSHFQEHSVVFS